MSCFCCDRLYQLVVDQIDGGPDQFILKVYLLAFCRLDELGCDSLFDITAKPQQTSQAYAPHGRRQFVMQTLAVQTRVILRSYALVRRRQHRKVGQICYETMPWQNDACSKLFEFKWLEPKSLRTMTITIQGKEEWTFTLLGWGMGMRVCVRPCASFSLLLDRIG